MMTCINQNTALLSITNDQMIAKQMGGIRFHQIGLTTREANEAVLEHSKLYWT